MISSIRAPRLAPVLPRAWRSPGWSRPTTKLSSSRPPDSWSIWASDLARVSGLRPIGTRLAPSLSFDVAAAANDRPTRGPGPAPRGMSDKPHGVEAQRLEGPDLGQVLVAAGPIDPRAVSPDRHGKADLHGSMVPGSRPFGRPRASGKAWTRGIRGVGGRRGSRGALVGQCRAGRAGNGPAGPGPPAPLAALLARRPPPLAALRLSLPSASRPRRPFAPGLRAGRFLGDNRNHGDEDDTRCCPRHQENECHRETRPHPPPRPGTLCNPSGRPSDLPGPAAAEPCRQAAHPPAKAYRRSTMALANSDVLTSVAPSIWRAKS